MPDGSGAPRDSLAGLVVLVEVLTERIRDSLVTTERQAERLNDKLGEITARLSDKGGISERLAIVEDRTNAMRANMRWCLLFLAGQLGLLGIGLLTGTLKLVHP